MRAASVVHPLVLLRRSPVPAWIDFAAADRATRSSAVATQAIPMRGTYGQTIQSELSARNAPD